MNKKRTLSTVVLCFTLCLFLFSPGVAVFASDAIGNEGTIKVMGESVITANPDRCIIVLAIETQGEDSQKVVTENAKLADRVINALKSEGLNEKQVKTGNYSLHSYTDRITTKNNEQEQVIRYRAYNSVTITFDKVDQAGKVVDVATKAGANNVQSIQFELKDNQAATLQALQSATRQAKAKAQAIADSADVKLLGIKSITEESAGYTPYRVALAKEMMADTVGGSAPSTPIVPGDVEIHARVIMEFSF